MEVSYALEDIDRKSIKNIQDVIDFIEDCEARHQNYVNHPKWCTKEGGSKKFHSMCVDRYKEILDILNKI